MKDLLDQMSQYGISTAEKRAVATCEAALTDRPMTSQYRENESKAFLTVVFSCLLAPPADMGMKMLQCFPFYRRCKERCKRQCPPDTGSLTCLLV